MTEPSPETANVEIKAVGIEARRSKKMLGVFLAFLLLLASLGTGLYFMPTAPIKPIKAMVEAAADPIQAPFPGANWSAADRDIVEAIVTARLHVMGITQKQLNEMVNTMSGRVEQNFLPWYLAFGRRKLEELRAYNYYASDRLHALFTEEEIDTSTPALTATFEEQFTAQVLAPEETRLALQQIGRRAAQEFGIRAGRELQRLQEAHNISFSNWRKHLEELPPLAFTGADGRQIKVSLASLAAPDPIWQELGTTIGGALTARFERMPSIVDREIMLTKDGESIFSVGKNAGLYFGSYVIYWIFLIILIRSGVIPISIFGALIGWVLWETFAWGSWIGLEYLDYEQTKAQLEPVIIDRCDIYFTQMRAILTDHSPTGPFKALFQLSP